MWQDIALTAGGFLLALTLVPTILDPDATVPRYTSIPTAVTLYGLFATSYYTLGLYLSTATVLATGTLWTLIAIFRGD